VTAALTTLNHVHRPPAQSVRRTPADVRRLLLVADADEWRLRALCRVHHPEIFYPPDNTRARTKLLWEARAKQVCVRCPVLTECRDYATRAREPHGVWGGTTPQDRGTLMIRRR
jgi:WhiB family redox-sensing transcriptional regulator